MRDSGEPFDPQAYLPAVTGYYTDVDGNMLSFPFNASTPILYYNKDLFRSAGLDPNWAPRSWRELGDHVQRLRAAGARLRSRRRTGRPGFSSKISSAMHNLPIATKANGFGGLEAALTIDNPALEQHIAQLVEWQKTKLL